MFGTETLVAVLTALGGGMLIPNLIRGIRQTRNGAYRREKEQNVSALEQRSAAIRDRDRAEKRARISFEYASRLRRQLFENGLDPEPWPEAAEQNGTVTDKA